MGRLKTNTIGAYLCWHLAVVFLITLSVFVPVKAWAVSGARAETTTLLTASSEETSEDNGIAWTLSEGALTVSVSASTGVFSSVTDIPWYESRTSISSVKVSSADTTDSSGELTSLAYWFYGCTGLKTADLSELDCSNVQTLVSTFQGCSALTSISWPSNEKALSTSLTTLSATFQGCSSLEKLDLSDLVCTGVKDLWASFAGCSALTSLTLPSFGKETLTDTSMTFAECSSLSSIVFPTSFDTSKVTKMAQMFKGCSSLKTLDLSGLSTSALTDVSYLLAYCTNLTSVNLSGFEASSATNTAGMFRSCSSLASLDISDLNTSSATDLRDMFYGCTSLSQITVGQNFTLSGSSTDSTKAASFPTPTGDDLTGLWQAVGTGTVSNPKGQVYAPSAIPDGAGNYVWQRVVDLSSATVKVANQTYTSYELKPSVVVMLAGVTLSSGSDYTVTYANNTDVGTASVTVTGKGAYDGAATGTFKIVAASLATAKVSVSDQTYTGSTCKPAPTVILNGYFLEIDDDYKVSYSNNTNAGTATLIVKGTNNYTGSVSKTFVISAVSLSSATVTIDTKLTYNGKARKPKPTVVVSGTTLVRNTDYKLSWTNNVNVGTGTVTITGKGNYSGTKQAKFKIVSKSIAKATVKFAHTVYTYTGKARKPKPTVVVSGTTLVRNTDYTVTYSKNIKVGIATVTIKGKGNYKSTIKATFRIKPKPTKIKNLSGRKKAIKLRWTSISAQVTGYQIQYGTKKSFKGAKTVLVKGAKKKVKTIKGLKAKKTYYVRIRTYKIVSGKKYYSSWSAVKKVKTKS